MIRSAVRSVLEVARRLVEASKWEFATWPRRYPFLNASGREGVTALCRHILELSSNRVFAGPFAGMLLDPKSHLATKPMMIVGSYEREIHDIINLVIARSPNVVLNIGSADGYYSVGLARHLPHSKVIASEADLETHEKSARELAALNKVQSRILQQGACTLQNLKDTCVKDSFVLCDCEGAEAHLLDPEAVPDLRTCLIACELHDFYAEGLTGLLVSRFRNSHHIEIRCEGPRHPADYRILRNLPRVLASVAVAETRHVGNVLTSGRFMVLFPKGAWSSFWGETWSAGRGAR